MPGTRQPPTPPKEPADMSAALKIKPSEGEPAAAPALPADATPDQKDMHWFNHVYQGDHVPQLTVRAVVIGATLGMLMAASNLYTTMKVGWSFGVAITSCVLSFVIWNTLRSLTFGRLTPMSVLENNCMQSTASAAGASTGATITIMFGALLMLDPAHQHMPWQIVAVFTLATGALGVFLAVPMKRQMINHEQLPFPSGIAAATTLRSLYSRSAESVHQAYALVAAMVVGTVTGILNTAEDQFAALGRFFAWMRLKLFDVHLPDLVPENGLVLMAGKPMIAFGFEPSSLLIAAGMIVGLRVSLSMLAMSMALYFFIAPWLQGIDAASTGVPGYIPSIPLVGGGTMFHPVRWSLWGGTAIMVFASLSALALQWRTVARSFLVLRGRRAPVSADPGIEARMAAIEVPQSWFVAGVIPISVALIAVQVIAFQIHWWAGLIAVAMSFVLTLVACRATGETDVTPIGAMGKLMQLLFAVISPGNVTHNLVSAGAGANSASSSADLLTDLKSGYLLGANPRRQFLAQAVGVIFGTLAVVPAWYLMVPDVATLEKYPMPATLTWVAVAKVLSAGVASLPMSARIAIVVGALIGIAIPVIEKLAPKARPWLPSAVGLGLGWVVFFSNSLSFVIGAGLVWVWGLLHKKGQERFSVPIASGLIAGESLLKAMLAMLATVLGLVA
jgi:putative OPT family oligopeptide transporter